MRIVVIGGRGHIGTYLVPRLVELGNDVVNVSRGGSSPYLEHPAWQQVQQVNLDRNTGEAAGTFGTGILELEPDIVVDLICFRLKSAMHIVEALRGRIQHYLFCGSIWIHGASAEVSIAEEQNRRPFGEYGIEKDAIDRYLRKEAAISGFPATSLHPGHIVGPGHVPINPLGNRNLDIFRKLMRGEKLLLPNFGMETLHHVHADDVAQAFVNAIYVRSTAIGEGFHVVSPAALTLKGYAEAAFAWFGREPVLGFAPWDEWRKHFIDEDVRMTYDHIIHSPNCSIEKTRRLIGYNPRYTSLQAVYESIIWLVQNKQL